MKVVIYFCLMLSLLFGFSGCAGGDDNSSELGSSSSALTAEEEAALDECLAEVKTCRLSETPDSEECREIYACVPDRPVVEGDREEDVQRFCEAVEERCSQSGTEVDDCDLLMERCLGDRGTLGEDSGDPQQPVPTQEECMNGCLAAGAGEADCDERCADLE